MAEWAVGQTLLGEYTIEKELGRGGMGRVWLVKSNSTGRQFAIKQTILKDESHRRAFLAELQTWIDLPEHPNIVPCRFFRTVGDEIVIFTDYVAGGSLADWIAQGKLTTLEQILDVAIQFAWGLHAIHERGFVHQDVKPDNVLMTAEGVPMVADFGLARARQCGSDGGRTSPAMSAEPHSIPVPGAGFMTLQYASPEQRAGQPLSRKTDIWSWAVSVLDMLMGGVSCPYGGHIAADVLQSIVENGQQDSGLLEMPTPVAQILQKCFARHPADRWENFDQCAQATIQAFECAKGVPYGSEPPRRTRNQTSVLQRTRHHGSAYFWDNPREWLRKAYSSAGRDTAEADVYQPAAAYSRRGSSVADLGVYEEAERAFQIAVQAGNTACLDSLAGLYENKALLCENLSDIPGALQAHDQCITIWRRLVVEEKRLELADRLAISLANKACALMTVRETAEAVSLCEQAIGILCGLVEPEGTGDADRALAGVLMNKAQALQAMGALPAALVFSDQSIAIFQRLLDKKDEPEETSGLAMALMTKGVALEQLGDIQSAISTYDHCIALSRRLVESIYSSGLAMHLAEALMNRARAARKLGDLAVAATLYGEAIPIYLRLVEHEGHRELANDLAKALMEKATTVARIGNHSFALHLYDQSITIYRQVVEQEGRHEFAGELAIALMNKGTAVAATGDKQGEITLYDQCITICRRLVNSEGHLDLRQYLALALMNKADAISEMGQVRAAVSLYDQSIKTFQEVVDQGGSHVVADNLTTAKDKRDGLLRYSAGLCDVTPPLVMSPVVSADNHDLASSSFSGSGPPGVSPDGSNAIDISDIYFVASDHKRYENGNWTEGDNKGCGRAIEVKADPDSDNYLVTLYNLDGVNPRWGNNIQIAPKRMRIVTSSDGEITMRGYGSDPMLGGFGRPPQIQENFGITLHIAEGAIDYVSYHYHDRDVRIDFLK